MEKIRTEGLDYKRNALFQKKCELVDDFIEKLSTQNLEIAIESALATAEREVEAIDEQIQIWGEVGNE